MWKANGASSGHSKKSLHFEKIDNPDIAIEVHALEMIRLVSGDVGKKGNISSRSQDFVVEAGGRS